MPAPVPVSKFALSVEETELGEKLFAQFSTLQRSVLDYLHARPASAPRGQSKSAGLGPVYNVKSVHGTIACCSCGKQIAYYSDGPGIDEGGFR